MLRRCIRWLSPVSPFRAHHPEKEPLVAVPTSRRLGPQSKLALHFRGLGWTEPVRPRSPISIKILLGREVRITTSSGTEPPTIFQLLANWKNN
jgi:hypothetical protein